MTLINKCSIIIYVLLIQKNNQEVIIVIIHIIKRDGRKVPFNIEKIANAIFKAAQSCGGSDFNEAMDIAVTTCELYEQKLGNKIPTVEEIQDIVDAMDRWIAETDEHDGQIFTDYLRDENDREVMKKELTKDFIHYNTDGQKMFVESIPEEYL